MVAGVHLADLPTERDDLWDFADAGINAHGAAMDTWDREHAWATIVSAINLTGWSVSPNAADCKTGTPATASSPLSLTTAPNGPRKNTWPHRCRPTPTPVNRSGSCSKAN